MERVGSQGHRAEVRVTAATVACMRVSLLLLHAARKAIICGACATPRELARILRRVKVALESTAILRGGSTHTALRAKCVPVFATIWLLVHGLRVAWRHEVIN